MKILMCSPFSPHTTASQNTESSFLRVWGNEIGYNTATNENLNNRINQIGRKLFPLLELEIQQTMTKTNNGIFQKMAYRELFIGL